MITTKNFFSVIKEVDEKKLPADLRQKLEFVKEVTENYTTWKYYKSDKDITSAVDQFFKALTLYMDGNPSNSGRAAKNTGQGKGTSIKRNQPVASEPQKAAVRKLPEDPANPVERVDDAVRFIKRLVLMQGKKKTVDQVRNFLNGLQRAIIERRIRKTSPYAKYIEAIQEGLVTFCNTMKGPKVMQFNSAMMSTLQTIAGSEKVRLSVAYMKRYVSLQGRQIDKEKAKRLHNLIATAINTGKVKGSDPYIERMKRVLESLKKFVASAKRNDFLQIHEAALNGINEALEGISCGCGQCDSLDGCCCQELNGFEARPQMMNSMDFADLKFNTLGFTGKWKDFIGDPTCNFTALVDGWPKFGKSTLCIEFAGYLARNHGKVLYVAKEEGLDKTLQDKLNAKEVKHPNLTVSSYLPNDLSPFHFIFLDSVTKLGLTPEDLDDLRAANPTKSFIFILQVTKAGKFRGSNSFQHDVDVVIHVPEWGKAIQMGRFNQGGEMHIFEQAQAA